MRAVAPGPPGETARAAATPPTTASVELSATTKPTAVRQAYAVLRAVLNTAVADDLLQRNPCRIKGAGQAHSPERPLLSMADVDALNAAMPTELRTLVTLAFWAHTRLGEVLGLRRGDVDLEAGLLRIEQQVVEVAGEGARITRPKAGSQRTVHLPTPALVALSGYLDRLPAGSPGATVHSTGRLSAAGASRSLLLEARSASGRPAGRPLPRPAPRRPHPQRAKPERRSPR